MKVKKGVENKKPKKNCKQISEQPQWKKIKLSGNLMSDDGGFGLEGLLGLEVLENPHKAVKVTKEKPIIIKNIQVPMAEENSDDSDSERPSKNQRKKKKKLLKTAKEKLNVKLNGVGKNQPGKFVRAPSNMDNNTDDAKNTKIKKKSKKIKERKISKNDDVKSNETAITIDELVVRFVSEFIIMFDIFFVSQCL